MNIQFQSVHKRATEEKKNAEEKYAKLYVNSMIFGHAHEMLIIAWRSENPAQKLNKSTENLAHTFEI